MKTSLILGAWIATLVVWSAAFAQDVRPLASTQDGMGTLSTNTVLMGGVAYRHVGAGAQPGGIGSSSGAALAHHAGFLQASDIKRPLLDTDGDGASDELDADNDSDGLSDASETDGTAFQGFAVTDLNDPDTDGDGMTDAEESAAMFDPLDPGHRLAILSFTAAADTRFMRWIGKGGGTMNRVCFSGDLTSEPFTNVLSSLAYPGGAAPWYKATNEHNWVEASTTRFFRVEIKP